MPDEADMLLTYDAVKEAYTLKWAVRSITYKHLIRMDGQRIADMTLIIWSYALQRILLVLVCM
ncbi:MAG: hypothetical protein ACLT16_20570 [[Clostridium] innocuum]